MTKYLLLLPMLAFLALSAPAAAQSDDADGGDTASAEDAGPDDQGVGGGFGADGGGFDSMYAGSEGPKDLYGYVANDKATSATSKREKSAADARKKRDEMVAKMKKNSERMLQQQKERAWKASHPGQPYPGAEESSDGLGADDDFSGGGDGDGAITDGGFGDSGGESGGGDGGFAGGSGFDDGGGD